MEIPSIFSNFADNYLFRYIGKWNISDDREIHTTTVINAPAEKVWRILTDYRAYGKWNPFIVQIAGKINEDDFTKVTFRVPNLPEDYFYYAILKVSEPNRKLVWRSKLYASELFSGRHIFVIEELSADQIQLTHKEKFSGLLVYLIEPAFFGKANRAIHAMDKALKERAEQLS